MFNANYFICGVVVFVVALGQVLFKAAAREIRVPTSPSLASFFYGNIWPIALVAFAVFLYALSTIAWIYALRTVPLSTAYMFNALAFLFVPMVGFFLFQEAVPRFFLPSLCLIVLGIVLLAVS
jgi:multidrug transporter EmrE-like cation transporter